MNIHIRIPRGVNLVLITLLTTGTIYSQLQDFQLLNEPVDISGDFSDFKNTYYLADRIGSFDPKTGQGTLIYKRYEYSTRMAFNNMLGALAEVEQNEFPTNEDRLNHFA